MKMRYIRWYAAGSSSNTSNHIVELEAFEGTTNRASGITATSNYGSASNLDILTNGDKATSPYCSFGGSIVGYDCYVQIDLGAVYDIDTIKVYPYWSDGRTYYSTRVNTSQDSSVWVAPYDSVIQGTFVTSSSGYTIDCSKYFRFGDYDFPLYSTANVPYLKCGDTYLQLTTDSSLLTARPRPVFTKDGTARYIQELPSTFTSWTTSNTTSQSTSTSWTTSQTTTTSWTTSYTTTWSTGEWYEHGDSSGYTSWNTSRSTSRTTSKSTTTSKTTSQSTTTSWTTSLTTGKTTKQGGWI
jgi:hypothetical protein